MTLAPGSTLAAYSVERLLGRGGMGEVYLATHEGLGRRVALKLLAPELAADPAFRERFIAESRLAASLDHPHIVPIYEAGEADGRLFLAMRYVEGDDLGALIAATGSLEPERAVDLLAGIGAALDAAHDRGLVHRDVKPANILVARTARADEHAYLGDFGLTKLLGSDAGFTRSGQLVGSVDYVAPEQIEGRPIDGRVDVYSLACVLYAALTGSPPYRRETEVATLWAHVQADPPRPSEVDPSLARYDPVIARGMAKDPADRHSTAGELMREARDARDGVVAAGDSRPVIPGVERVVPPPSVDAAPAIRDLPAQISELIGRERELAELADLLSTHRLITITGSGGSGKTRLALELGWTPPDPTADVWFVDLSAIREPEMVPGAIASRLGVTDDGKRGPVERLEAHLVGRNAVLILDNFEQILDAAPVIAGLLAKAPRLRILATSRAPLRLRGEREYPLGPLALASAADPLAAIEQSAAVRLFVERARDAGATITVDLSNGHQLADICRRLDSLPLAIELAAARIRDLDLDAIGSGLDRCLEMLTDGPRDAADRQRTVRMTIDWSHELIEPAEAALFRRLSVFSGGCSAEAAESVCGEGLDGSVPALLAGLIAQSLLVRHPATEGSDQRYSMLETIREYAAEQLEMSNDRGTTRKRHAGYFASLAERAEAESRGADAALWRHRIRTELENMRAAIGWAIEENAPEPGLRIAAALRSYLLEIGYVTEGREWLSRLLELPGPRGDRVQANALNAAGNLAWFQADFESARAHHTASLAIRREIGEPEPIAASLSNLAVVSWQAGDYRGAQELLEDSLAKSREAGDAWGVAATLGNLADVAIFELNFEHAEALYQEALADFRTLGDVGSIPKVLSNLGELAIYRGDDDAAAAILAEARTLATEIEDNDQTNTIRINLGRVAARRGDFEQARKLLAESFEYSQATGEIVRVVECLERLGELVAREGDQAAAARIWGSAAALRRDVGAEMYPVDRAWYDDAVATTRAMIGDSAFESEWAAGERADHAAIAAAYLPMAGAARAEPVVPR
jgi:predicted ATPase/Tfp pilus assembly protein PilF